MPSYLRIAQEGRGIIDYLKCFKAPLSLYAGPMPALREKAIDDNDNWNNIWVDVAYRCTEAGDLKAWYFYHANPGIVKIGDVKCLILRESGSDLLVVHVLGMSQDMDGSGIWEHDANDETVAADDMVGFWVANAPSSGGILPTWRFDYIEDQTNGSYQIDLGSGSAPIQNDTYAIGTEATLQPRRIPIQCRGALGPYEGPLTNANDAPYEKGTAPITGMTEGTVGVTGTPPEFYVVESIGTFQNESGMFDLDPEDGMTLNAGEAGDIYVRLVDGTNDIRISHVVLGMQYRAGDSNGAGMRATLYYLYDNGAGGTDNDPATLTDWREFFSWPEDAINDHGIPTSDLHVHQHIHLAKRAKWIRLNLSNQSATNFKVQSLLIYTVTSAVGADGKFEPDFGDTLPEYIMATYEGATLFQSRAGTEPGGGVTRLQFDHADTHDFDGISAGDDIWLRVGSTRTKYEVDTVNSGASPPYIDITGTGYSFPAGQYWDTRFLALRVDAYDTAANKIRESPAILVCGVHQEKWFRMHQGVQAGGIP